MADKTKLETFKKISENNMENIFYTNSSIEKRHGGLVVIENLKKSLIVIMKNF